MEYKIEHISDIAKIPREHLEEFKKDLDSVYNAVQFVILCDPDVDLKKTYSMIFTPDGKGESTYEAICKDTGKVLMEMVIEENNESK